MRELNSTGRRKKFVTRVRFGGIAGRCFANARVVGTLSSTDFGIGSNRFAIVLNPDNTNGSALLGLVNKVRRTAGNRVVIGNGGVTTCGSGGLAGCETASINFIFRFCGLVPALATLRGISLIHRVYPGTATTRTTLRDINLGRRECRFPDRLSNNRRREISVTHTIYGGPRILLYSRPANTLSDRANIRVLALLRGLDERGNGAIVVIARGSTLTRTTSGIVEIGGNGVGSVALGRGPGTIYRII